MNSLELLADGLFLPLSFHASLSDIRTRTISAGTEQTLLLLGVSMLGLRIYCSNLDITTMLMSNLPPLVFLLIFSVFGKSGFGDLEYATSMALFYPSLCEATTLDLFPSIFGHMRIRASVLSIALMNAILIAWLTIFHKSMMRYLEEHNLPIIGAHIPVLATLILVPGALLLTPFLSKLVSRDGTQVRELPLIPLMFTGFMAARFAHTILL